MKTLKFKCTLLSDVILNQKASSEGPNQTLDFIPGSCFLGIAAAELYDKMGMNKETLTLFHSNCVRFGDAHPIQVDEDGKLKIRSLKVPVCFFYPKGDSIENGQCKVSYLTDFEDSNAKGVQWKKSENGFYCFYDREAYKINVSKNFAIKSAYDREKRRSKDEQMFGYQSLQKGLVLYFEVELDNDSYDEDIIIKALEGNKRVGRSRTAQFGLVTIEYQKDDIEHNIPSTPDLTKIKCRVPKEGTRNEFVETEMDCALVYADGRLIFLDNNGLPTFDIKASDLGISNGEIIWEKSQIKTFQYAPWNYTRQCFDADRCGFEKGSVFVVKTTINPAKSQYVGSFKNEGFGKVIYNPFSLTSKKTKSNGNSNINFKEEQEKKRKFIFDNEKFLKQNKCVWTYLSNKKKEEQGLSDIYRNVNDWVETNAKMFATGERFKAQWGNIRSIAMKYNSSDELVLKLYDQKNNPNAYLVHGVTKEQWNKNGRLKEFIDFVTNLLNMDENSVQQAIINLAAQMQRELSKEKEDEK